MSQVNFTSDVHWHFDFDGTLFFTHKALINAYQESISEFGGIFSNAAKEALICGESYKTFLKLCSWATADPDLEIIRARKNDIYLSNIHLIKPNNSLIAAAISLFPNVSIVTSSNRFVVTSILNFHNLGDLFQNIVSSDDVMCIKPNPEPYLKSASKFPNAIHIAVEDSELGLISAQAAGLLVLRTSDVSK